MGCGAGQKEVVEEKSGNYKVAESTPKRRESNVNVTNNNINMNTTNQAAHFEENTNADNDVMAGQAQGRGKDAAPTPDDGQRGQALPQREKNVSAPLIRQVVEADVAYSVSHYAPHSGLRGSTFAIRTPDAVVFSKTYSDAEFSALKESKAPQLSWGVFWRALVNAFAKDDAIRVLNDGDTLEVNLKSNKEPKPFQLLIVMDTKQPEPRATFTHFINPFTQLYTKRKEKKEPAEGDKKEKGIKEDEAIQHEGKLNQLEAADDSAANNKRDAEMEDLRGEATQRATECLALQAKVDKVVKGITRMKEGAGLHPLDGLYSVGGPRPFQHLKWATVHFPQELPADPAWLRLLEDGRITDATPDDVSGLIKRPTDPEVVELIDALPDDKVWQLVECFEYLDKWNYDAFAVEQITEGRALFYTSYALFVKYGFMKHFKIPREVVVDFFTAIQAGYCPNRYHNSIHAADVMQILHFVLGPGGMVTKCKLSNEDIMAALISAAIHDYNHPGLNNNFHTRVSAYLSTLYNDRSILESHHCACSFELMNHKKYDIFQTLSDDQKKDVRDTVVEMLLSTDMGNHAKIFSAFKRRQQDGLDWGKKKEDVRLALVMAIKLADISNCGRPTDIYLKWAERISEEFYLQGDAESIMGMPISPFMDRRKHKQDFHKGQVSFMNYIVTPLFDSVSDLLPNMRFTLECCASNRDHWKGMP